MMRRVARASLACLLATSALAGEAGPVTPLDAGKWLGKDLPEARQEAIVKAAKPIVAGDWKLGFGDGPEGGLYRDATTRASDGGAETYLSFSHEYKTRCDAESRRRVGFDLGLPTKAFPVRGKAGGQQTVGWVSFTAKGKPATPPKRQIFGMDEMQGELHPALDPDQLKASDGLVICPTAKPWDGVAKDCVRLGLEGFARALDYVCDAK